MALRKLAWTALKEKHHIPQLGRAMSSKVASLPGLICRWNLFFLAGKVNFQPFYRSLDFLLHFFIKKKVEYSMVSGACRKS
jgi:hypothetical protein